MRKIRERPADIVRPEGDYAYYCRCEPPDAQSSIEEARGDGASRLWFLKKDKHCAGLIQLCGQWFDFEIDGPAAPAPRQWYSGIPDGLLRLRRPAQRAGQRQR